MCIYVYVISKHQTPRGTRIVCPNLRPRGLESSNFIFVGHGRGDSPGETLKEGVKEGKDILNFKFWPIIMGDVRLLTSRLQPHHLFTRKGNRRPSLSIIPH